MPNFAVKALATRCGDACSECIVDVVEYVQLTEHRITSSAFRVQSGSHIPPLLRLLPVEHNNGRSSPCWVLHSSSQRSKRKGNVVPVDVVHEVLRSWVPGSGVTEELDEVRRLREWITTNSPIHAALVGLLAFKE